MGTGSNGKRRLTRRRVLKAGATALGGGAALLTGAPALAAQQAQAPAVLTGTQTGRTFRGLVRHEQHARRSADATAADRPAAGRHPLNGCGALLHDRARRAQHQRDSPRRGPEPLRLRRGRGRRRRWSSACRLAIASSSRERRSAASATSACTVGRTTVSSRSSRTRRVSKRFAPFAEFLDGTPVYAQAGIGGMSEIMTAFEEYCVPVFTDLPAAQLTLLGDQLASGFAAGHADMRFRARLRRRRLRRRTGRPRRGAGRPCHGRRPGHRRRSDQVPSRVLDEAGRDDDARSQCRRRRHRRAHP